MSFGTSVGDIISLIQLAHQNYRNCKQAGGEYLEIAREVRNLHSVLKSLHDEAEKGDLLLFQKDRLSKSQLSSTIEGCKDILTGIEALLVKYRGLAPEATAETSKSKKLWHRMRFGAELDELGKFRWKIITYTSTLAVLLDSVHMKATDRVEKIAGRVEGRVESGFAEVLDRLEGFEDMRKAVLYIATQARSSQQSNAMDSVLSLSTYADDDKEVWRQFRSQLVSLGFRSDSLDRHKEVLKAYMLKLDQTGVLDDAVARTSVSHQPWCGNASFRMTNLSLLGVIEDDPSYVNKKDPQLPDSKSQPLRTEAMSSEAPAAESNLADGSETIIKPDPAEAQQLQESLIPSKIVAPITSESNNSEISPPSTGIGNTLASSSNIYPSGRRRISRAMIEGGSAQGYSRPIDEGRVWPGTNKDVDSLTRTPRADDPPPYSKRGDAFSLPAPGEEPEQRDTNVHSERDKLYPLRSDIHNQDSVEDDNKSKLESKVTTSVNDSIFGSSANRFPPHPYAESFYSVTEAALSQSTLIASLTEITGPDSNLRVGRSQDRARPSSWDGSDTRGSAVRNAIRPAQIPKGVPQGSVLVAKSDKKPGSESLDTGDRAELLQDDRDGAEKERKRAETLPDKQAKVKWAEGTHISYEARSRNDRDKTYKPKYRDSERTRMSNNPKVFTSDKWQRAAGVAVLAGALEAFGITKEAGGMNVPRVLAAAIGAAGVHSEVNQDPFHKSNSRITESLIAGLTASRIPSGERGRSRTRRTVTLNGPDIKVDSDGRVPRASPGWSYGSTPIPTRLG